MKPARMMLPSSNRRKSVVIMTTRWMTFLIFFLIKLSNGFSPCVPTTRSLSMPVRYQFLMTSNDDDDEEVTPVIGMPESRMGNYAAQFLDKIAAEESSRSKGDEDSEDVTSRIASATFEDISEATHLIAIPLESSHELLIELESVQRAILHHCPILLDACIGGTTTRLPLLYIKALDSDINDNPQNSAIVTNALAGTIKRLVKRHIFGTAPKKIADDNDGDTEQTTERSLNAEGYLPLTMTFKSLEIDGANNNILNTVGSFSSCDYDENYDGKDENGQDDDKNYNERRFESFIRDLQSVIASRGWKMAFPPDPNRAEYEHGDSNKLFRPRVAFMELPKKFDENINRFKDKDTEITEEVMKYLTAEEGGNGISPIFWCNWWDDVFARNVRLQQIGIYPANPMRVENDDRRLVRNSQFYLPFETIALPNGDEEMTKSEKKFFDYNEKRMKEMEEEFRKQNFKPQYSDSMTSSNNPFSSGSSKASEPDLLMTKTRTRLENIYMKDSGIEDSNGFIGELERDPRKENGRDEEINDIIGTTDSSRKKDDDYIEDWMLQRIEAAKKSSNDEEGKSSYSTQSEKPSNDVDNTRDPSTEAQTNTQEEGDYTESWMKEKIEDSVNSLGSMKNRDAVKKEPKYSVEENPVFKAYKEGKLTTKKPKVQSTRKLGPYPGNDHFVGIWKIVVSPMGDSGSSSIERGSENLILRVDGTTAAGPILNSETNQKAAGGTWKMLIQENGDVLLRIRLVIPPEKKRILVMEGRVNRGPLLGLKMASRTFGIPLVEERAKQASRGEDDKMVCSGEAYTEDAVTKKNKISTESFYMEKAQGGKDPDDYTVIIPKTIRRLE